MPPRLTDRLLVAGSSDMSPPVNKSLLEQPRLTLQTFA